MVIRYTANGGYYREPPYDAEEIAYLDSVLNGVPVSFSSRCSTPAKPQEEQSTEPRPEARPLQRTRRGVLGARDQVYDCSLSGHAGSDAEDIADCRPDHRLTATQS